MSPLAPDAALQLLADERAGLARAVSRIPLAHWTRAPAQGRWSVVEVLEHLTRVETGIARLLSVRGRQAEPGRLPADPRLEDARLTPERAARVRDRGERIDAPERIRPTGTTPPAGAWDALEAARAALLAAAAAAEPASLDSVVHEHPVLGPLLLRDWIEFVAHHEARHAAQVHEPASELGEAG